MHAKTRDLEVELDSTRRGPGTVLRQCTMKAYVDYVFPLYSPRVDQIIGGVNAF